VSPSLDPDKEFEWERLDLLGAFDFELLASIVIWTGGCIIFDEVGGCVEVDILKCDWRRFEIINFFCSVD